MQPIVERDKKTYREYERLRDEYQDFIKLTKKEREETLTEEPIKPFWQKFLLSDFTPEALVWVHKVNKRGIGINVDELAGWFKNFNRYNKGSEMEFWLSSWSGKPINIDRKSSEPVFIPNPFISVAGTIQTGILSELAKDNRAQNGFIDRILFVLPENIKKQYWDDSELDPNINMSWHRIVNKLLDMPMRLDENLDPVSNILKLAPNAKQVILDWQKENTDRCNNTGSDFLVGVYSKMDIYLLRIALILQLLFWACDEGEKEFIGMRAAKGAIAIIDYFRKSADKIYQILSSTNPLETLPSDKQELFKSLPDKFTTEMGVKFAKRMSPPVSERTFKRFLRESKLFKRVRFGEYEKSY